MKNMKLTTKIFVSMIGLIVSAVLFVSLANIIQVRKSFQDMGTIFLRSTVDLEYDTLQEISHIVQGKLETDLDLFEGKLAEVTGLWVNEGSPHEMTIVNQVTKQSETVQIPTLMAGSEALDGKSFQLVDDLLKKSGGTATIFQVLPGKLLRVSTNVKKLDGNRAVGTYIPASSPVYKTVMAGNTYKGRAFVVNDWYLTAYKPYKDSSGNVIAVIYSGRKLLSEELKQTLSDMNYAGKGYSFVFNSDGVTVYHPEESIIGKKLDDVGLGKLLNVKDGTFFEYMHNGHEKIAYIRFFKEWDWHLAITVDKADLTLGAEQKVLLVGGLVGILVVLIGLFVAYLVNKGISRPLNAVVDVANKVSAGNLELRAEVTCNNEVGQLSMAFNQLLDNIARSLAVNEAVLNAIPDPIFMSDESDRMILSNEATKRLKSSDIGILREAGEQRRNQADGGNQSSGDGHCTLAEEGVMECNLDGKVSYVQPHSEVVRDKAGAVIGYLEVVRDVTEQVVRQRETTENLKQMTEVNEAVNSVAIQVASGTEELSAQVEQVSRGVEEQKQRFSETATAVEQMNATILEVARNAGEASSQAEEAKSVASQGAEVVRQSIGAINDVNRIAADLKDSMSGLGSEIEAIGRIMNVIDDIADQTNLLALNAAIEAARAGDAGRGFAVVADEVRKLAEKTMDATKEVGSGIKTIQDGARRNIESVDSAVVAVETATGLAERSGESLEHILTFADTSADQIRGIATASEEQSAASEQISRSVEVVSQIANHTADGMAESSKAIVELAELARKLESIANK